MKEDIIVPANELVIQWPEKITKAVNKAIAKDGLEIEKVQKIEPGSYLVTFVSISKL